jgi:hypothetical protein
MLTVMAATSRLKGFLSMVGDAFLINTMGESATEIHRTLEYALCGAAESGFALIVDEVQTLELDALRTLLHLCENARLPLTLACNPAVLKRRRSEAAAFDQISDRLVYRETITVTKEAVQLFGTAFNVEGMDAYEALVRFGLATSLRQVDALLRKAWQCAGGGSAAIRLPHLADALQLLRGADDARKFTAPRMEAA